MTTGKKITIGAVIVIVVLVVAVAIAVPLLLDVDRYRPEVVQHIRAETGKPAAIGHLSLTVFPTLSVRVDDLALGNPAGFPEGAFLKVRSISAQLDAGALWNREVLIKSLQLNDPVINLLSDVRGRWNFENAPEAKARKVSAGQDKPMFTLGVIAKLAIEGAQVTATNLLPSGRPGPAFLQARGVSSQLEQVHLNAFAGSASAWPRAPHSRAPLSSIAALFLSTVYAAPPQSGPAAQGRLNADSLAVGSLQATAVKTRLRLFPKQIYFDDLNFVLYGGRVSGPLAVDLAGQNPRYSAQAQLNGVDVARLLASFPEARGKMTGKMDGNIKLSGEITHSSDPLAGVRAVGQVSVRNGQLPSLQLNKNLMLLARVSNLGPASGDPSSFSSISADFKIADERITSDRIAVVGNGVTMDGSGTIGLAGAGSLDCQGVAKIVAGQNSVSQLLQGLTGGSLQDGKLTLPFNIAGTLGNPRFILKSLGSASRPTGLEGLATGQSGQQATAQPGQTPQQDLIQGLAGLLKKKKQAQQPPAQQPKQ